MVHELSSAQILSYLIIITPILQLAFASQAVFAVNETIKVPVSLGVTSKDDDALYVQVVFDNVLKQVSNKVNMTFGYVKECVFLSYMMQPTNLMKTRDVVSGLMTSSTGCDVLQTGLTVRETYNSCACVNTLHNSSGGTLSCVKTERERRRSGTSKRPRSVLLRPRYRGGSSETVLGQMRTESTKKVHDCCFATSRILLRRGFREWRRLWWRTCAQSSVQG